MKFVFSLLILLLTCNSFAKNFDVVATPNQLPAIKGQGQEYPSDQNQEGIPWGPTYRRSKVKVTIYKATFVRSGDRYENIIEKVCTKESSIKVWDRRQPYDGYTIPLEIKCETKINGEKIIVSLGVDASVSMQRVHFEDNTIPMLNFWGMLFLSKDSNSAVKLTASSGSMSKDLDLKSTFLTLGQEQNFICPNPDKPTDCTVDVPEVLNANVEYIGE